MNRYFAFNHTIPLAVLFGAALLAGCSPVGRGLQRVGTNIHEQTVDYDRRIRSWFDSENALAEQERGYPPSTGYCYRTLGEVSCYPNPVPGQDQRMVGLQVPDPMFDPLSYPIPEERPEAIYLDLTEKAQPANSGTTAPPPEVTVAPAPPLMVPQTAVAAPVSAKPEPDATPPQAPRELMPVFRDAVTTD